jgi:predicted extracellular nuclease
MKRHLSVLVLTASLVAWSAYAASPNVVISQVYGGGGNSGATLKNDFIELFNRGTNAVSVTGWSVQYASASGTSWQRTNLSGTIQPGQYYLVQESAGSGGSVSLPTPDATGSIPMSATNAKVALVSNQTTITSGTSCPGASFGVVDFVGYGTANCHEGADAAPGLSNTTADFRADGGCTDTDDNAADFSAAAPDPRNSASPLHVCGTPTGVGTAEPPSVLAGSSTLLMVTVTPGVDPTSTGLNVVADLSAIGGAASQMFYDDGTNGDVTAGDDTFSFQATVSGSTTAGAKTLPATITDAQLRFSSTSIPLFIEPEPIAIHDIQGSGDTSPYEGQLVSTSGIVTGVKYNGFFLQTPDAYVDSDPNTSEGVFVFTSSAPAVAVGDDVKVVGTVQEYIPSSDPPDALLGMTEIAGSPAVTILSSGNPLPAPVTLTSADTDPSGALDQLERFEGMRVHVESLTVVGPTGGSISEANATSTSNGVFYGVLPGIARPFVEPGVAEPDPLPLGSPSNVPRFDANPERLRVDSDGLDGATSLDVTSGATVTNLTGPLDYGFRTYTIDPDPGSSTTVTGNISAMPVPDPCPAEFTVATANLERFFDTTNDPSTSDVVLTLTAFANRLDKVSLAIRNVMEFPDIIGVEEVENLDTLQAIADKVSADAIAASQPDPHYVAYLEEGNDIGGIDVGFLVKTPKVNVVDVTQVGKDAMYHDPVGDTYELLNDRPPLVMHAEIQVPDGSPFPVTVIVNHLRSLSGIDDPIDGARVRAKRAAQAEFLAVLIEGYQDAGESVISIGDYNATQFNDGYVDVMGTIEGTPAPPNEVVLATAPDLVSPPLTDLLDFAPASQQYSYVFDGNAEELDHILVTSDLLPNVSGLYYARDNADFPESYRNDATRPERYSDHDVPVAYFGVVPVIGNASATPSVLWPPNHKMITVTVTYDLDVACDGNPATAVLSVTSNEPVKGTGSGDTAPDWIVVDSHHVKLRAERAGGGSGRVYTISIIATDSRGEVTTQDVAVTVPHNM